MNLLTPMRSLAAAAAILAGISAYAAPTDLVDFTAPGAQNGSSSWNLGFQFHVNTAISLTALGVFDFGQDGLVQAQQVGLWTTDGTLLASAFVDNSDALQGFWRFHSLSTAVSLQAGGDYIIGSQGGEGYTYGTSGFTNAPEISFTGDRWVYLGTTANSPLTMPTASDGFDASNGGAFFGANAQFGGTTNNVPDDGATALLSLIGVAMLGLVARKRRKA